MLTDTGIEGSLVHAFPALLHELLTPPQLDDPRALAAALKALPLTLVRPRPLEEAISTAGGVRMEALDAHGMLRELPGVFCAGKMTDWEAPTARSQAARASMTSTEARVGTLAVTSNAAEASSRRNSLKVRIRPP